MRFAALLALLGGCFAPQPPAGAPCNADSECPSGLSCQFGQCTTDDSFAARVGFTASDMAVDELSGTVQIHVTLTHPALVPVHASYAVTDRKSTRLNSSHGYISYAVFCLKKKT